MITYEASYLPSSKPVIVKIISLGGEEYRQPIPASFIEEEESEADNIPTSVILQHLENFIAYIQQECSTMRVIGLDEPKPDNGEHITNFNNIWWAKDESRAWWFYIRTNREPEDL